jgi:5-methylcytosine-specific restriction endonuclease McrA
MAKRKESTGYSYKDKQKFRQSRQWQNFRKYMLEKYPACAFCGNSKSTKTVHHTKLCETKEEYENLEETRFIVLCSNCHRTMHTYANKKALAEPILQLKRILQSIGFGDDWIKL